MKKILLIRMDRIGDLVLTLPVDQLLAEHQCQWVITRGLEFVPELSVPKRKFLSFPKKFSFKEFFSFLGFILAQKPDEAVIFHAPWWVSFVLFLGDVPLRAGVKSQWHSYIFLNKGVRQKRSKAEKHEMHYNLDLVVEALGLPKKTFEDLTPLRLDSVLPVGELSKWNLKSKNYVVVHPGMGGSAKNWPTKKYQELIEKLSPHVQVVVTGGSMDSAYVDPLKTKLENKANIIFLDQKLNIQELILVLKNAKSVLAPSTGVVHLAASLGVPTLGIYSPIPVERALRWGPKGDRVATISPPDVTSTQEMTGQEKQDMMDHIQVEEVFKKLKELSL